MHLAHHIFANFGRGAECTSPRQMEAKPGGEISNARSYAARRVHGAIRFSKRGRHDLAVFFDGRNRDVVVRKHRARVTSGTAHPQGFEDPFSMAQKITHREALGEIGVRELKPRKVAPYGVVEAQLPFLG